MKSIYSFLWRRKYQISLFCLILLCLLSAFTSCQKKDTESSVSDTTAKGRYVEQDFKLPDMEDNEIFDTMTADINGLPLVYTHTVKEKQISFSAYQYTADGTFTKKIPEWLQKIPCTCENSFQLSFSTTSDGTQYFLLTQINDGICHGSLYFTKDGTTRTQLMMDEWDKQKKDGSYMVSPMTIGVLDNGFIIVNSYEGLFVYDQNGKKQYTLDENGTYMTFTTHKNTLLCTIQDDGTEQFKGVAVFDGTDFSKEPVINMFRSYQEFTKAVNINDTGDLYFVNSSGICLQKAGTDVWQTILDGSLGTMYVPNVIGNAITADADNNYYVYYVDYNGIGDCIIKYYYDSNISSVPDKELSVYTLRSSNTLRKAANEFQKAHPDVKVTIEVAMPEENDDTVTTTFSKHDYIQALNTQLLAGDGCDLINVVGLPIESYIQKGTFLNLTDLIDPLCAEGRLLNNLIDTCRSKDKLYTVPVRFQLPTIFAPIEDCPKLTDIKSIAAYAGSSTDDGLMGKYCLDDFLKALLPFITDTLFASDGSINPDVLTEFLYSAKIIADKTGLVASYTETDYPTYPSTLAATGGISLSPMCGIIDATLDQTYMNYVHYGCSVLNNSFTPSVQLSINSASKQPELAKEFLKTLLSEPIQVIDLSDGFPVQTEALEQTSIDFDEGSTFPMYDAAGNMQEVPIITITGDLRTNLVNQIQTLNRISRNDDTILDVMTSVTPDYFEGKLSLDETAAMIQNKLSLYTEE